MELNFVVAITDREKRNDMTKLCEACELPVALTWLGKGTATNEHLSLYGLSPTEKAIIGTVAGAEATKKLFKLAKQKMYFDIPGNGLMISIPIKSVGGGKTLALLTDNKNVGGSIPDMKFNHELIIVILNEGYSDDVMDAARSVGAAGGTVLHAKGTGAQRAEKFFGVSLAAEKDIIYIVSRSEQKAEIMRAINSQCGPGTNPGAICFSLPISAVVGLRVLEDD